MSIKKISALLLAVLLIASTAVFSVSAVSQSYSYIYNYALTFILNIYCDLRRICMTYSDAIIKRLTDLCVERGITTNKLATLSGITQSTLNSMMRGETKNPKLKTLRKIAMGFNMTVSELLDFPEMNEMEFEDE